MSFKKDQIIRGIIIRPDDIAADGVEGEIKVGLTSKKLHVYLDGALRSVVTEAQVQTLTNKTLTSAILNTGVSGTAIDTDVTLAANSDTLLATQKAVKTYVDVQLLTEDQASEIEFTPAGTISATNVQAMGVELDSDIQTHIADTSTHGVLGNIVGTFDAQTLSNKTIIVSQNTITTAASGNLTSTSLNPALAELQADIDLRATLSELGDHINDPTSAHAASAIANTPSGNLAATTVQSALNELQTDIDTSNTNLSNHLADAVDAHAASAISVVPAGNLAATEVQAALVELQTDIDAINTADAESSFTIANNTASATDVTGLVVLGATYRGFTVDYAIYRKTDTALSGVAQIGELKCVYNTQSSTWLMSDAYSGQNAGVTFSITALGQIQYTSTNITGATYAGTMKYNIRKRFLV